MGELIGHLVLCITMHARLQFGEAPSFSVSVPDEAWIRPQYRSVDGRLSDVAAATADALGDPLAFPPLAQALVPGDRVAIAMGDSVRGGAEVVRGVAAVLNAASIPATHLSVVVATTAEAEALRRLLREQFDKGLEIVVHDPTDRDQLVFVAAFDDQVLRLNRHLGEADVVIPVACARHPEGLGDRGPFEAIYPRFSDVETISRHYKESASDNQREGRALSERTERAGWLLGASLVIETVPARDGGVAAVFAGAPEDVARRAAEWCDRQWRLAVERRADLVIVTIGGGTAEQTWSNVARALHAARRVTDETQSAIVLCTELKDPPGPALKRLGEFRDQEVYAAELSGALTEDAASAWELFQALEYGPVYMMCQLPHATVEELGMAPLEDQGQLARLIACSGRCLILNDGQHAIPELVSETTYFPN